MIVVSDCIHVQSNPKQSFLISLLWICLFTSILCKDNPVFYFFVKLLQDFVSVCCSSYKLISQLLAGILIRGFFSPLIAYQFFFWWGWAGGQFLSDFTLRTCMSLIRSNGLVHLQVLQVVLTLISYSGWFFILPVSACRR